MLGIAIGAVGSSEGVVYRDTTEPTWSHRIKVGNVTSFTVEGITKDNFLFGVRAVDRDGNRSVVTFPRP